MYTLILATPEKTLFEGEVISLLAPGSIGYLEVLTDHAPLITTLKKGNIVITKSDHTKETYPITEGVLEVLKNKVSVLVDI